MYYKLKNIVLILKIIVGLLLSRPFRKSLFKFIHWLFILYSVFCINWNRGGPNKIE